MIEIYDLGLKISELINQDGDDKSDGGSDRRNSGIIKNL